jgi:hypothetical protein
MTCVTAFSRTLKWRRVPDNDVIGDEVNSERREVLAGRWRLASDSNAALGVPDRNV